MRYPWFNVILCALLDKLGFPIATTAADLSYYQIQYERSLHDRFGEHCNSSNIAVRKNWDHLNASERTSYIDAVKCLRSRPALTPQSVAPGVFHRMDDFTYQHIKMTPYIHFSGWLLPWHRYFIHQFERALRDECGYTGYQPYWDWTTHWSNISATPLFDGSELSLGSNGQFKPHEPESGNVPGIPDPQFIWRPPGTGGGCVTDGPWGDNFTVTLGPIFPNTSLAKSEFERFDSNPRCLSRDFLQVLSSTQLQPGRVVDLLQTTSQNGFRTLLETHVHFAGHSSVGGDLVDLFTSPNDPTFYFHHAQLDRIWALWQDQNSRERLYATSGTVTYNDSPPSLNASLGDTLEFGPAGGDVIMFEVVDTVRGRLCYRYE